MTALPVRSPPQSIRNCQNSSVAAQGRRYHAAARSSLSHRGDDRSIVRQRALQRFGLIPWSAHPYIALLFRGQDESHFPRKSLSRANSMTWRPDDRQAQPGGCFDVAALIVAASVAPRGRARATSGIRRSVTEAMVVATHFHCRRFLAACCRRI